MKEEAEHTQCSQRDFGRLGNDNREQKRRTGTHVLNSTVGRHFPGILPTEPSPFKAVSSKRNYLGKATIPSPIPMPRLYHSLAKERCTHLHQG